MILATGISNPLLPDGVGAIILLIGQSFYTREFLAFEEFQ
jgi:hypothetical protein